MNLLRIGFVGLGGIARQRHIPGLRRIEGIEIRAVVNRSRVSSERAAAEFGIPNICDTWQELVARTDLDAVVIGTWPYLHAPVSIAALELGKHVFTQARMAMNLEEALRMRAVARASGRVAMICPVPFGLSVDAVVARLRREGWLGDVRLVRVESYSDAYADPAAPMNWRKDERLSGLNVLTLGMYIEVIHRWFGPTRAVSADTRIFTPERVDMDGQPRRVLIPDQVLALADMEAGFPVQYVFSGVARQPRDVIEIYGSRGTLHYDIARDLLTGALPGEAFAPMEIRDDERYDLGQWRVEEDFVNAIRHGREYHPNFDDGVRYMQVIEAIHTSAARGARVAITLA